MPVHQLLFASTACCCVQVLGTYADYYVFEATMKEQPEEEEETLGGSQKACIAARSFPVACCSAYGYLSLTTRLTLFTVEPVYAAVFCKHMCASSAT